jgi:hypothetical protein
MFIDEKAALFWLQIKFDDCCRMRKRRNRSKRAGRNGG